MQTHLEKLNKLYEKLATDYPHYSECFVCQEIKKGDYLIQEGQTCNHFWYIEKGLFRCFYRKEANEVITYFGSPGMYICSTKSYILQKPGIENIQAITDAVVYSIDRKDYQELSREIPLLKDLDILFYEVYLMWLEERLFALQFCSAQERYDTLLQTEPHLIKDIPVTYLASYLGVTIETLSRIRSKQR